MMALRTTSRQAGVFGALKAAAASFSDFSTAAAEASLAAAAMDISSTSRGAWSGEPSSSSLPEAATPKAGASRRQPHSHEQPQQTFASMDAGQPLGAEGLAAALSAAPTIRQVTWLLLSNRPVVCSEHLLLAIFRMGHLQRLAASTPTPADQEAFAGALEVALDMLAREGHQLCMFECCRIMEASAWMALPPSPQQQVVMEASLVASIAVQDDIRGMVARDASNNHTWELLLSSYVRLGLHPGPKLAVLFAPPMCQIVDCVEATTPDLPVDASIEQQRWQQQQRAKERQQQQQGTAVFQPLHAEALTVELGRASTFYRVLRLALLHGDSLDLLHRVTALNAMARIQDEGALAWPVANRRAVFAAVRARALAQLAGKRLDLGLCRQLLTASARMRVPLSPEEQAVVEAAAARGIKKAHCGDLLKLVEMYADHGYKLQPGSGFAAALLTAAEQMLPDVSDSRALSGALLAWHRLDWQITPELAAAAQAAALSILRADGGQPSQTDVLRLLETFTTLDWPLARELAAELKQAMLLHLPGVDATWTSLVLSCCRKLGLLPDEQLQETFLAVALTVLPTADPGTALTLLARLLMPLERQGWQYSDAAPLLQATMQMLLHKLHRPFNRLKSMQLAPREVRGMLGSVTHCLQLLAACGLRPEEEALEAACAYLKRHEKQLSQKQQNELQCAFGAWQYTQHGLDVFPALWEDEGSVPDLHTLVAEKEAEQIVVT